MKTAYNFNAGPCVLPKQAIESAIEAIQKAGGTFEKVATPIRESQKTAEKDAK